MGIKRKKIEKIEITAEGLDPVTVIFEDVQPGHGRTIIEVFGDSWAHSWMGLGEETMEEFFCSAGLEYLVGKLAPFEVTKTIDASTGVRKWIHDGIVALRKETAVSKERVRELMDTLKLSGICDDFCSEQLAECPLPLHEIFGDEWWYSIPKVPNPAYQYIVRIVTAIRSELEHEQKEG